MTPEQAMAFLEILFGYEYFEFAAHRKNSHFVDALSVIDPPITSASEDYGRTAILKYRCNEKEALERIRFSEFLEEWAKGIRQSIQIEEKKE